MKLSPILQQQIIDFLTSLPNLHDSDSQRALVYHAGLDEKLLDQIPFGRPSSQFVPLLVSTLLKYGNLKDGRHAIIAVLDAAQNYVGQDKKADCEALFQEVYSKYNIPSSQFKDSKAKSQQFIRLLLIILTIILIAIVGVFTGGISYIKIIEKTNVFFRKMTLPFAI